MTGRQELIAAAEDADVGTACALMRKLAPNSPTPGELITWISKMRPDVLDEQVGKLEQIRPQLDKINSAQVQRLYDPHERGWDGASGRAFENRWKNDVLTYVGTDGSSGRRGALKDSEDMLSAVTLVMDKLQQRTAGYVNENLKGLYMKLLNAVKEDTDKASQMKAETLITAEVAGVALAVGATGPVGAAAGALGIVVAAVFGFMKATVTDAQKTVGAAVAGSAMSLPDIQQQLTSFNPADHVPYKPEQADPGPEYKDGSWP